MVIFLDKNDYVIKASNPRHWLEFALIQKKVADQLLDAIIHGEIVTDQAYMAQLWSNAHYHYGIGIENGLKALIIEKYPELVKFKFDNEKVSLKGIGVKGKLSHNLHELALEAGLFELIGHKLDTDKIALEYVLSHLTDSIKWLPKYPVPSDNHSTFKYDGAVPVELVYGFHILDVIAPLFDLFKQKLREHIELVAG